MLRSKPGKRSVAADGENLKIVPLLRDHCGGKLRRLRRAFHKGRVHHAGIELLQPFRNPGGKRPLARSKNALVQYAAPVHRRGPGGIRRAVRAFKYAEHAHGRIMRRVGNGSLQRRLRSRGRSDLPADFRHRVRQLRARAIVGQHGNAPLQQRGNLRRILRRRGKVQHCKVHLRHSRKLLQRGFHQVYTGDAVKGRPEGLVRAVHHAGHQRRQRRLRGFGRGGGRCGCSHILRRNVNILPRNHISRAERYDQCNNKNDQCNPFFRAHKSIIPQLLHGVLYEICPFRAGEAARPLFSGAISKARCLRAAGSEAAGGFGGIRSPASAGAALPPQAASAASGERLPQSQLSCTRRLQNSLFPGRDS